MMREEFQNRTGFFPAQRMYAIIEKHYMSFVGDKDAFCEAYKKNARGLAESIQREADQVAIREETLQQKKLKERDSTIKKLQKQIDRLKADLEREAGWKPYECSKMPQDRYEKLAHFGNAMRQNEAKKWIEEEFGFRADRIEVLTEIPQYQINRHKQVKQCGTVSRPPVYDATDWNYIRFNCGAWQYEVVDGELYQYSD